MHTSKRVGKKIAYFLFGGCGRTRRNLWNNKEAYLGPRSTIIVTQRMRP
jgi:hypothetical protein